MHTFKDAKGREWEVAINVQTIREVKAQAKIDLLETVEADAMHRLSNDPVLLANVLWVLVKDQAATFDPPVTDEDFGRALGGDVIDEAVKAFIAELLSFFPKGRRAVATAALGKMTEIEATLQGAAIEKLNGPGMERIVDEAIGKMDDLISGKTLPPSEPPEPGD